MPRKRRDPDRIEVVTNPDDPSFGEFAFTVYDNFHPVSGRDTPRMRRALRGWTGYAIRFGVKGYTVDWSNDGRQKGWNQWRYLTLARYRDLFGPDGALLDCIKTQVAKKSDLEVNITLLVIARE